MKCCPCWSVIETTIFGASETSSSLKIDNLHEEVVSEAIKILTRLRFRPLFNETVREDEGHMRIDHK